MIFNERAKVVKLYLNFHPGMIMLILIVMIINYLVMELFVI